MTYERFAFMVTALLVTAAGRLSAQDSQARARHGETTARNLGNDHFAAGSAVSVTTPVVGDLIAAGRHVDVSTSVDGDAALAGGEVRVHGRIGQDLYAAGGQVAVQDTVARNARIAGGQITITPEGHLMGNASIAGGEIRVEGRVDGYLQVMGRRAYLDGPVGGDVYITAKEIVLGPSANITGKLRYASDHELQRDPGARVQGGIERRSLPSGWEPGRGAERFGRAIFWIWTVGLMLLAAVLILVLPGISSRVGTTLRAHPGKSTLLGLGIVIVGPVVVLLLVITLIGLPLAVLGTALYVALLLVGYVSTGIALGDWALGRARPAETSGKLWRIGAAVIAVLGIALVGRVPILGGLVCLFALFAGIGALLLFRREPRGATSPLAC